MVFTTLVIARAWEAGGATAATMFNFGATQPGFAFTSPHTAPAAGGLGLVRRKIVQRLVEDNKVTVVPFPLMNFILCRAMTLPLNIAASYVPSVTPPFKTTQAFGLSPTAATAGGASWGGGLVAGGYAGVFPGALFEVITDGALFDVADTRARAVEVRRKKLSKLHTQ